MCWWGEIKQSTCFPLYFRHELHHECTHLLDYNKHQTQHYQTSELWYRQIKGQLEQVRTLSAMYGIDNKSKVIYGSQHGDLETSWQSVGLCTGYIIHYILYQWIQFIDLYQQLIEESKFNGSITRVSRLQWQ